MKKAKIAISLDAELLKAVDLKIDNSIIRSRSQAIEFFLKRGLQEGSVDTAVLLLRGDHQQLALKSVHGTSLISRQLEFFSKCGIKKVYIVTQYTKNMNSILSEAKKSSISVEIVEKQAKGNAEALLAIKEKISSSFIVMSGDTYNNFDLIKMIKKHSLSEKLATMGLMTREKASSYGTAILDGDLVVDFEEKPKHSSTNIVNAGIYIFKPEIFELFDSVVSLEKDLFPKIARLKQLAGFFTYGEYLHFVG
ncbi:MAG TPA: sugar phosphate nucleotidyltransferase [Candidatus Nanoarchaeia archaeon]|nr:sugar phosphate nucleotidyltransferase [Candidatus Nanoarchaeia archaeon]